MESSIIQNQTSSVGDVTTSLMYSSSQSLSSLQTSTPGIFSTPGILSTVSSSDISLSLLATIDDTSPSQLVTSRLSLLQGPSSTLQIDSQTSTLTVTHLPAVTLTSSLSELSASVSSQPPVSTPALEASSSVDVAGKSEGPSSSAAKLSASSISDISYQVSSTPSTSTIIKYSELSDFVSSNTFPISGKPLVTSSTEISSFESGTPILSSHSKIQPTSDVTLSSPITQTSSTFYSSSPSLIASSTQLTTLNPVVSSTILPSQSSTQDMSTDPIIIQPTSSMKTYTPSGVLPVLPTTVTPAVTPTTGKTNDTISNTPSPLLGTGLELIIALSIIGAGLLIFLIITVCVCVRRKKPRKEKYDPNAATEDLWVSRTELPLNHIDPLPQIKTINEGDGGTNKFGNGIGITHFNTATVEEKYITKFDFDGKDEEYLSLREGDIVVVVHKNNNGWWTGSLNGKTGLFPGNYVKEIPPDVDFEKNNRLSNGSQPFEISLDDVDSSAPRPVSSFMAPESGFTKKASTLQREPNKTSSLTRHALGKKVEIPHIPDDVEDDNEREDKAAKRRSTISPVKEDLSVDGVQFKVLCSYTANFKEEISLQEGEIVTGIKKDRNGWMYGRKNRTNEIGHFPAVHVEKATPEDIEAASYSQFGYPDKATVYKQLQANKTSHHDEDLIGIEHRALHYYAAEDEQDLSFDKGDIILVYEVNENGWWRGKHGEEFGWFPGSYVELVDEDPSELKYKGPQELSVPTDQRVRSSSFLSVGSAANISKTSDEETGSICSTGTTDSRRRPARKAPPPPPPMHARSPKTPTSKQPPRPSNVPWASQAESTPIDKSGNQIQDFSLNGSTKSFNDSDSVDGGSNRSVKPDVPKRFIKPKLVKISKKKINLKSTSSSMRATKSPPPPRPEFPKHIPKSPLNRSKDDSNQYSKVNGTHKSISESQDSRSNSQNHSNTIESDISGVEPLQQSGSEKDQSLLQNESEIGNSHNSLSKNSKPGGVGEQTEKSSTLPSLINKPTELSPNEARHSTPKYHDTPKFSDPPIFNGRKLNGSVEGDSTVPESETSITEVSCLDETDGDMKSLKVPPSPKRSRLPMLSGETGANANRARSKERPPPVAPKPLHRPSQIQRLRSIERNQSEAENSSHDQSSLQDDSSSILIHDGLDSSNGNSAYLSDGPNQSASAQIKRPNVSISKKSPQKQTTNNTRIPKTSSGAMKRPSSVTNGKQSENFSKDYSRQTSTTSQNSGGFPETISPGKPPTPKPKRPDNPPMKSDTPTRRKTSASPSRIPLGKSPTRKSSDSGAKSKIPQTNSPDHSKSSMLSKIPTVPTTDGQRGGLTKSSTTENPKSLSKTPSTEKSSPSKRGQSAIPKLPRPSRPFVPVDQVGAGGDNSNVKPHRMVLKKAVSGYEALNEGELSFDEGSLITELSEDAENPGWCVGRLPDGTTGRFHASFVEDVPAEDLAAV